MTNNSFKSFASPANSLRAAPFWAWNSIITKKGVKEEIAAMKEMGFGGFFMHSRVGMNVPYLSDEWFDRIKDCIDEAKKLGMDAWLYDEDRWPSGAAGGFVTRDNPRYRCSAINWCFYDEKHPASLPEHEILAYYAVVPVNKKEVIGNEAAELGVSWLFRKNPNLVSGIKKYRRVSDPSKAKLAKDEILLCFFRIFQTPSPWYNDATYIDVLSKEAVAYFINITHKEYFERFGKDFGKAIPGIFFDEPNFCGVPWTDGFEKYFEEDNGYDVVKALPEILLNVQGKKFYSYRYDYYKTVTNLFTKNFVKQIGDWCKEHNIKLTGHMLEEDTLSKQTRQVGSTMRCYEYMQLPGMDLLTEAWQVYDTPIQCCSVARQMGYRHRITETYGCTGWDFPAEGHKALADWQLALGITLRCHHLVWYTMLGENKRDYPASIFIQSPWYKQYKMIEDTYARIGALMYNGKEQIDILVVHPVESMWGIKDHFQHDTSKSNLALDNMLISTRNSLLGANLAFDYGDEDIMARHYSVEKEVLHIGQASYKAIVIPELTTIRSTTLKLLSEFAKKGGSVYYINKIPEYIDGKPSKKAAAAYKLFKKTSVAKLADTVGKKHRRISIYDKNGEIAPALYLINEREDGTALFICNTSSGFTDAENITNQEKVRDRHLAYPKAKVALKHEKSGDVYELNPENGKITKINYRYEDGTYKFDAPLLRLSSHLFFITETKPDADVLVEQKAYKECKGEEKTLPTEKLSFTTDEPNAIALDHISSYTINGKTTNEEIFVLSFADKLRAEIGLRPFGGGMCQPWVTREDPPSKSCSFSANFDFECKSTPAEDCIISYEQSEIFKVKINGKAISRKSIGYFMDPCVKQFVIPKELLIKGKNTITIYGDFNDKCSSIEAMYIQGNFGVNLQGQIVKPVNKLSIGDWSKQGLLQYTGNLTYHIPVPAELCKAGGTYKLKFGEWKGFALRVGINGKDGEFIAWPPYELIIDIEKGKKTTLDITVYGNRRNLLGPFYYENTAKTIWYGPGEMKCHKTNIREYQPIGLLTNLTIVKVK